MGSDGMEITLAQGLLKSYPHTSKSYQCRDDQLHNFCTPTVCYSVINTIIIIRLIIMVFLVLGVKYNAKASLMANGSAFLSSVSNLGELKCQRCLFSWQEYFPDFN